MLGNVVLNYANPLHEFDSSSKLTYTTVKECWLFGTVNSDGTNVRITIDENRIFNSATAGASGHFFIPLAAGSTIVASTILSNVKVYDKV